MTRTVVTVAVEGDADVPVIKRLLALVDLEVGPVHVADGKDWLDQKLPGYNRASQYGRWLVLRDMDQDADCAPVLVQKLLPQPHPQMCLRVAVRAAEAWLLADWEQMSRFLHVSRQQLPSDPDSLLDPKRALVDLARRSRQRAVREDLVPAPGTTARVGPGYTARIIEFAHSLWRPEVAAQRSDSLARCLQALKK